MAGYQLTSGQMKAIRETVRTVMNQFRGMDAGPKHQQTQGRIWGATIGNITAATAATNGETTFTFAKLIRNSSGDLADSGLRLTGTNRDTSLVAVDGTLLIMDRICGEWIPVWVGCEADASLTGLT